MQNEVQSSGIGQPPRRLWWLMPRPFDWLSSSLYLAIFIVAFVPVPLTIGIWKTAVLSGVLLALLLIDRLEYWRYGETVPLRMAVFLFILRIVLIQATIPLEGSNFTPF